MLYFGVCTFNLVYFGHYIFNFGSSRMACNTNAQKSKAPKEHGEHKIEGAISFELSESDYFNFLKIN